MRRDEDRGKTVISRVSWPINITTSLNPWCDSN